MVGAVLVRAGKVIGRGWHRRAGLPHAEIEALLDAQRRGHSPRGSTLYVTLEPCSTHGRTPPCTEAIVAAGIRRVVVAARDPNPRHAGRGLVWLRRKGIAVEVGPLGDEATALNEAFNHWIVHRTPLVRVKAAMSLDGKIGTTAGESKWITSEKSRAFAMNLRLQADAIIAGVNTIIADDPLLSVRPAGRKATPLRRFILDPRGRTPLSARIFSDSSAPVTVILSARAGLRRQRALEKLCGVWVAPERGGRMDLRWILKKMGVENITSLLVEGGGETNARFLLQGHAHQVAFFYAPKIIGGAGARKTVGGSELRPRSLPLTAVQWLQLGPDLLLLANIRHRPSAP